MLVTPFNLRAGADYRERPSGPASSDSTYSSAGAGAVLTSGVAIAAPVPIGGRSWIISMSDIEVAQLPLTPNGDDA